MSERRGNAHPVPPRAVMPAREAYGDPCPSARGRLVFISVASAFSLLGDQVLYSVLPVYFTELGLAPLQVGLLLSVNRWVRLLTNHVAHVAVDRFPPRALFIAAFALGTVTTVLYTATWSFAVLLVARLLWGLAWSFIRHVGVLCMMTDVPPDRVGRTMGAYNGITRTGSAAGLFLGAVLVDLAGYHPAMLILAALSLVALPLAARATRRVEVRSTAEAVEGLRVGPLEVVGVTIGAVGSGFVMSTLGAVLAARMAGGTGAVAAIGLTAATLTGALLAVRFALDVAASPWLGSLTDRFGLRRTATSFLGLGAVALAAAHGAESLVAVSALVLVFYVSGTALNAGVAGTAARSGSRRFSRYLTAVDLGSAAGPLVGWWLLEATGVVTIGLVVGAALFGVTAIYARLTLADT